MDRVFDYIARFAVITFGYALATIAASLFAHMLMLPALGVSTEEAPWAAMGGLIVSVPFIALLVGYFAFFPAAAAIAVAELAGWRGFLFHAFAGAGVAFVATLLARHSGPLFAEIEPGSEIAVETVGAMSSEAFLAIAATGIVAGIAYWLVAGRSAGFWPDEPNEPAETPER